MEGLPKGGENEHHQPWLPELASLLGQWKEHQRISIQDLPLTHDCLDFLFYSVSLMG